MEPPTLRLVDEQLVEYLLSNSQLQPPDIQVFQSLRWPQGARWSWKWQSRCNQALSNGELMGCVQELSEFQHDTGMYATCRTSPHMKFPFHTQLFVVSLILPLSVDHVKSQSGGSES